MYVAVAGFRSRTTVALAVLAMCALMLAACGDDAQGIALTKGPDAGLGDEGPAPDCDLVQMDGEVVVKQIDQVTARFLVGEPVSRTVMLFGGEPAQNDNAVSDVYIIGLDKEDALMLAQMYPAFHLCGSPGAKEAEKYILAYDLVPATCRVFDQIVTALRDFHRNNAAGGDRVSLRLEGAPLQLESVLVDATGEDVTDQLTARNFHLVTAVEQLTGESVLSFGTTGQP